LKPKSKQVLPFIRIVIGFLLLGLLIYFFNFTEIISQFKKLDPFWVLIAGLSVILSTIIGSFNLYLFVNQGEISFHHFFPIYWIAWAFGLIVPGQIGDMVSLSMFMRKHGLSWQVVIGRSLGDKVVTFAVLLLLASLGFSQVANTFDWNINFNLWVIWVILLGSLGFYLLSRFRENLPRFLKNMGQNVNNIFAEIRNMIEHYPLRVVINFILTWLKVILIGVSYWAIFSALGFQELGVWDVLCLMAISSIAAYLPVSFNGLGVVEAVGVVIFATLGVPEAAIIAAYICLRILVLSISWIPVSLWMVFSFKQAR